MELLISQLSRQLSGTVDDLLIRKNKPNIILERSDGITLSALTEPTPSSDPVVACNTPKMGVETSSPPLSLRN